MRRLAVPLFAFTFVLSSAALAQSAEGGDLQRYHPAPQPWGGVGTGAAETLKRGDWTAGLYLNYARNPLIRWAAGERASASVANNLTAHVTGGFGIFDWLSLEAEAPFVAYQSGDEPGVALAAQAMGDLRLTPRFGILSQWKHGIALSFAPTVTVPLGGAEALAGDPSVGFVPEASLSYRGGGVTFASQVGVRARKQVSVLDRTQLGPEATLRVAAAFEVTPTVEALIDFNGGLAFATIDDGMVGNPLEILAGARFRPASRLSVTVGAGTALLSAPGTPDVRLIAGVSYGPGSEPVGIQACTSVSDAGRERRRAHGVDTDGDGIDDACDLCPAARETMNGLLDEDGCPDSDRDGDGILDTVDECPDAAGLAPTGCPDADADGLLDRDDHCPLDAGPAPTGCPDTDGDGVLDKDDHCPAVAGTNAVGCPE